MSPGLHADEQEWVSLISRTAQGDQVAFGTFFDRTSSHVHGLVLKILGDHAAADEVTLDVFMQAWRQAHTYDESRGSPGSWLLILARSRAIDRLRAGKAERARRVPIDAVESLPHQGEGPEESRFGNERQRLVHDALSKLVPEQREAIALAYFSDLSQSEIATKLELPLGTVKTRVRLGMIKLRHLLAPHAEGLVT